MTDSLDDLLSRAKKQDEAALRELLDRFLPGLRAHIRLQCGPTVRAHDSCSDIVQEVCVDLITGLKTTSFRDEVGFRRWLYKVGRQKVIDRARYHNRAKRDVDREVAASADSILACYGSFVTPSRMMNSVEQIERIETAFDSLAPRYRQVITMARLVGLSFDAIGQELDVTPEYARVLLSRGLAQLLDLLDREGVDHGFR